MNENFSLLDILQTHEVANSHFLSQINLTTFLILRSINKDFKKVFDNYFCDEYGVKAFIEGFKSSLILLKNGQVFGTGIHDSGGRGPNAIVPVTKPVEFLGLPKVSKIGMESSVFYFKREADNEVLCDHSPHNWNMTTKVFSVYKPNVVYTPDFSSCDQFQKKAAEKPETVKKVYEKYSDFGFFKLIKSIKSENENCPNVCDSHTEKDENNNSFTVDDNAKKSSFLIP